MGYSKHMMVVRGCRDLKADVQHVLWLGCRARGAGVGEGAAGRAGAGRAGRGCRGGALWAGAGQVANNPWQRITVCVQELITAAGDRTCVRNPAPLVLTILKISLSLEPVRPSQSALLAGDGITEGVAELPAGGSLRSAGASAAG